MEEGKDFEWANAPSYARSDLLIAGKPIHAVLRSNSTTLCGIRRSKWAFDLFNKDRCKRCAKKLGVPWRYNDCTGKYVE